DPKREKELQVLSIAENGFGKRTELKHYKVQNRGGSGIRTLKVSSKTGKVVAGKIVSDEEAKLQDLMVISKAGQMIRMPFDTISILGRDTQGVRLMRFKAGKDIIASTSLIDNGEETEK
ncbi:MAG: DNA gyrase C-terminal beta-propeller domain-containing protein, partial [Patescibacteria group bacterium]